jgi:3-methyladenine DNA glycosylase AlkD
MADRRAGRSPEYPAGFGAAGLMTVQEILRWLERRGTRRNRDGMARYAITSPKAFGVSVQTMRPLAKRLGRDHELALALWDTGWLEARVLASLVDDPARVTPRQMEQWVADFDNWAVCDSACIHLFDRTPHGWTKIPVWARRKPEFVKRAAFATLAGLAVHDKKAPDRAFIALLPLIEDAADDERNFVKKAVNWALRQIGKRNRALNARTIDVAGRLAASESRSARWIGKDALRELTSTAVRNRISAS